MERKAISKKIRFEIFKRDKFTCQYCGMKTPEVILEIDHIVPVAVGGGDEIPNLITSCRDCNSGKGARPLGRKICREDIASDASDLQEKKKQLMAFYQYQKELKELNDLNITIIQDHFAQYEINLLKEDIASIRMFLKYFTPVDLIGFLDIAVSKTHGANNQFKYFCGIAWSTIREMQKKES